MLIDSSFFVGEINIPNTNKPEIQSELNHFIAKYESDLLNHLMGNELYGLYLLDRQNPQDPRFESMINGVTYGDNAYWRGFVYSYDGITKHSMIAYYTYWFWIKDKSSWNSGIGVIRPQGDKADAISPAIKMINAWNTFSEQVNEFISYMMYFSEIYPEWAYMYITDYGRVNDFDI